MNTLDVVITTNRPIAEEELNELREMGLRLVAVLPEESYRFRGSSESGLDDLRSLSYVRTVTPFSPTEKLDATLKEMTAQTEIAAVGPTALSDRAPTVRVLVSLDTQSDITATLASLEQLGTVMESSSRRALVEVETTRVVEIAALPGVIAAEIEPENRMENNVARGLIGAIPTAVNLGLDGSGEIVGVADSGLDTGVNDATLLADFAGRVLNIRATVNKAAFGVADGADLENHGTHVCGSIAGNGANSNGNLSGVAPAAQLTVLSMGPNNSTSLSVPADLITGVFQDAYNDGARLHNNSWSSNVTGAPYTAFSDDVDQFVRDHPDILILLAAGNAGPNVSTVRPPGTAKNCLTVGASESVRPLPATISIAPNLQNTDFNPATPPVPTPLSINNFNLDADNADEIASFSGRGPTADSRIKPDIVAPGSWILSCRSQVSTADVGPDGLPHVGNITTFYADDADGTATHAEAVGRGLPGAPFFGTWNPNTPDAPPGSGTAYQQNYFYNSGTSMATPIATGATALLRQYLRQQRGIANPSAALIKALLVNGATVPAGQSNVPNNTRGFGWLDLQNTLTPAPTGQQTYSDDVDLAVATGDIRQFSVQLADTSHPFRVTLVWNDEPGSGIQNRLYLRVIAPDTTVFDGDLTAFPTVSNNVQRVHIDSPMPGTYTIEVHGVAVLFGIATHLPAIRQDFALAVINGIGFSPEPVDIVQVIDKSGSMNFYNYMDPARERAKQLVDMLRINDRTGVVTFNQAPSSVNPVVPITGLATQNTIKANIAAILAGGSTSIGAGLNQAKTDLAIGGDPSHPQAFVLLSDGHENTPPWVGGGATNSPPAWYTGPDFTEVLPTIPPGVRIYTVSLGVQSDATLLQSIASSTGGVFHAIHSQADIGKLHEIYIHLQALTGGEEVIAAGSSTVDGINPVGVNAASVIVETSAIDGALLADLAGLTNLTGTNNDQFLLDELSTIREHYIPVDESLRSITFMVSWHDPSAPVSLELITPQGKTIHAGNIVHFNLIGSSYQFFRIENPMPGLWTMLVRCGQDASNAARRSHAYTWGAYGKTPLALRYLLPKELTGASRLKLSARLDGRESVARTLNLRAVVNIPVGSIPELLKKHANDLRNINLPFETDSPDQKSDQIKLAILDMQRRKKGEETIFTTRPKRITLTKRSGYTSSIKTPISGLYDLSLVAKGTTKELFNYQRLIRFDVQI